MDTDVKHIERYDSSILKLEEDFDLPPFTNAQAVTTLFLAVAPKKKGKYECSEINQLIDYFEIALQDRNFEKVQNAFKMKLMKMLLSNVATSNYYDEYDVLSKNFTETDLTEDEVIVLQYYEIFQLLSIHPIPSYLKKYFKEIVEKWKIPISMEEKNPQELKRLFVYTENNILKEICDLFTPSDISRFYNYIRQDKSFAEYPASVKNLAIEEVPLTEVEGLKEVAFYYLMLHMIQTDQINRIYTHHLESVIENLKPFYESERDCNHLEGSLEKLKRYPLSSHPPGICIVFSMEEGRTGAHQDNIIVRNLFEKVYRYDFVHIDNPTRNDIEIVISKLKEPRNKFYDSLVVWFMGHGKYNSLKVQDGFMKRREEFLEPFTKIKLFNKKPKLFFIQACDDPPESEQQKKTLAMKSRMMVSSIDAAPVGKDTSPVWNEKYGQFIDLSSVNDHADTLVLFATNRRQCAARNQEGSLWVQTLIGLLETYGHKESIEIILRKVNYNVNTIRLETEDLEWKQTPFYESSLQKELIFPRRVK